MAASTGPKRSWERAHSTIASVWASTEEYASSRRRAAGPTGQSGARWRASVVCSLCSRVSL